MQVVYYVLSDGVYFIDNEWDYRGSLYKTKDIHKATIFKYEEAVKYLKDYIDICNLIGFELYKATLTIKKE